MEFPKFLIHGEYVVFGHVELHGQLKLKDVEEKPLSGGSWRFNRETKVMILTGKSFDFGTPSVEDFDDKWFPPSMQGVTIYWQNEVGELIELKNYNVI